MALGRLWVSSPRQVERRKPLLETLCLLLTPEADFKPDARLGGRHTKDYGLDLIGLSRGSASLRLGKVC
jgi:hypothetical protein